MLRLRINDNFYPVNVEQDGVLIGRDELHNILNPEL